MDKHRKGHSSWSVPKSYDCKSYDELVMWEEVRCLSNVIEEFLSTRLITPFDQDMVMVRCPVTEIFLIAHRVVDDPAILSVEVWMMSKMVDEFGCAFMLAMTSGFSCVEPAYRDWNVIPIDVSCRHVLAGEMWGLTATYRGND